MRTSKAITIYPLSTRKMNFINLKNCHCGVRLQTDSQQVVAFMAAMNDANTLNTQASRDLNLSQLTTKILFKFILIFHCFAIYIHCII